ETTGSHFLEPEGHFPKHGPKPDNSEAMKSIQTAVLANQADLGIIFDTDVDRSAVVDQSGEVLNRNNLIDVLAGFVL
ncbi:phosphomannomutase/phosphoglucomutase, partial [Enterococcus faecalis]